MAACLCHLCIKCSFPSSIRFITSNKLPHFFLKLVHIPKPPELNLYPPGTTKHGQRHFCTACGTTMTIVYDSQPDCVWPAAGTLEDNELFSKPGSWCLGKWNIVKLIACHVRFINCITNGLRWLPTVCKAQPPIKFMMYGESRGVNSVVWLSIQTVIHTTIVVSNFLLLETLAVWY